MTPNLYYYNILLQKLILLICITLGIFLLQTFLFIYAGFATVTSKIAAYKNFIFCSNM